MSCDQKKNEFIPLDHMTFTNSYYKDAVKVSYYILIDNPDSENILKKEIIKYAKQKLLNDKLLAQKNTASLNFVFYKKTSNTSYFITHKENSDGLLSEEISHYQTDFIANYYISKCNDGTMEKIYLYDLPEEIVLNTCKK
ncbi:hypothetical protein [Chryseobacterium sp. 52]|uniref:hypothetical protein n=1 Tax=Chryseobacterium sp. 52 TaxID=2035213 RepID=UPI000C192FE5|nr:hypothetical protein [Chryseobacterium sp. 52]